MDRADVAIVGGGPAGLALAIACARRGLRPVVIERARPPIDKACGEGLMPSGVERLRGLGAEPAPDGVHPFAGIRYVAGPVAVEARFRSGMGWGVRRTHLHAALVRAATGLDLRFGVAAEGLMADGVRTSAGPVRARWIVGADGLHSSVRRMAGLTVDRRGWRRFGVRRHYALPPWSPFVEVHWSARAEAYVTPVGPRRVGIALLWGGGPARFDALLDDFPDLRERLEGAPRDSRDRGAGPMRQRVPHVVRGKVALVGDAAGYLDALTGEGLSLAFRQAEALAGLLAADRLAAWPAVHRRLTRAYRWFTGGLLAIARRPPLRRRLVPALARDPELFARMLAVDDGTLAPARVGLLPTARFAARLLAPTALPAPAG